MKRLLFSVLVLSFISNNILYSQSVKEFKKLYVQAESYFIYNDYYNSLPKYVKLIKFEPLNSNLNYAIGLCYLNLPGRVDDAIPYLERASTDVSKDYREGSYKEKQAPQESIFYLGKAYLLTGEFDKAIETFQKYRKLLDVSDVYYINYVDLQISHCKNAKELIQSPVIVEKEKLQNKINTDSKEFNPIVSNDGEMLLFSRYLQMLDREVGEIYFITAIYQSNKKGSDWSTPINITRRIGSEDYCETSFISGNGKHLLVNRVELDDSYNIYESYQIGSKWSEIKRLHKYVNSHSNDLSAMLTDNGSTIYFVSDRSGGYGGKDIYKSVLNSKGNWNEPINLGATINTEFDEETPFFLEDNKTLYFSSEGHHSMGGLDVFYSKQQDNGTWSEPFNIGYPVNTLADDLGYYPVNSEYAYYSTYTDDIYSDKDIYKVRILPNIENEEPLASNIDTNKMVENVIVEQKMDSVIAENVTVKDTTTPITVSDTKSGTVVYGIKEVSINGNIHLQDNKEDFNNFNVNIINTVSNKKLASIAPDGNGNFSYTVNPGNYKLIFSGQGYQENSKTINISTDYNRDNAEVSVEMIPVEVSKGEYFVIKSIFFDYNNTKLNRNAQIELEKLNKLMAKNPSLYLEVTGHTDSRGSTEYNMSLSKKRARSVIDYLVNKNIDNERFVAKGVGETDEVAINQNPDGTDNPEGRKYNRRVDIKILRSNNDNIITQNIYVPEHLRLQKSLTYTILLSESIKKYETVYFEKYKDLFSNVWISPTSNGYAYSVGEYLKKSDAISLLNKVIDNGFPDARIINNLELKKIHESGSFETKAKKQKQNEVLKNGIFTIQLMALKKPVELSYFSKLKNVKKYLGNDGYTRYTYGEYKGYKAAKDAIKLVIDKGFTDAFVVNTKKYK